MRLFAYAFNSILALLLMLVAVASLVIVVGDAVVELWGDGRHILSVLAAVGFPITFVIWPWTHEAFGIPLWAVFIAGVVSFKLASFWTERAGPEARANL